MPKKLGDNESRKFGYRPTNVGYIPRPLRSFIPSEVDPSLPKAPASGTGERFIQRPKD